MDQHSVQVIMETLKEEGIDLAVTLPEEPTYALTEAMRKDPFFTAVTVAGEGNGIAFCAGAALGGRRCVFVTGIAGLLVASWALAQMGMVYGAPILILASYRGDFGDHSGIPGSQLLMFKQVAEPLLGALRVPYRVVSQKPTLKRMIQESSFACQDYSHPIVLLMTGEVLW
jgi:sulfopyruvate decarboxylase TPP-binding subunit